MIGNEPARQPHHLNAAPGLALQPAARLDPIEIAIDVELQQDRRMIRRPTCDLRIDPAEPELGQIELIDEDINYPNRILLIDPVFQAFRKQRDLFSIRPFNEAPHSILPQIARESYRENQIQQSVFTQPGSKPVFGVCPPHVCLGAESGIPSGTVRCRSSAIGSRILTAMFVSVLLRSMAAGELRVPASQ